MQSLGQSTVFPPARVSDTQTGLRAFGVGLIPWMQTIQGDRYEYEMNVLMACPRERIPIQEVPIEMIYLDNNSGSRFHTFRDSFLIYRNLLKFAASSLAGFAVDYGLFSVFSALLLPLGGALAIPLSNICARVISAAANFAVNKHFVFRNQDSVLKTGAEYFLLAVCILAGNTVLLSLLVNTLGVNKYAAKLVTEIMFFTFSFLAQRFLIFRRNAGQDFTA